MHAAAPGRASLGSVLLALATLAWIPLTAAGQLPTPTDTPTPITTPSGACVGDCDGDGSVSVRELVALVSIALGQSSPAACETIYVAGDGKVHVYTIVAAVDRALRGCASRSPTRTPAPPGYGMCYESSDCFPCDVYPCRPFATTRESCCELTQVAGGGTLSWCPADQFDPTSLACAACEHPCAFVPLN
jgi:hypothetical protein